MDLDTMPGKCCVKYCKTNRTQNANKLFRLPAISGRYEKLSKERQKLWLEALEINDANEKRLEHLRVCQDHFVSGRSADILDRNNPDWIPSLNMRNSPDYCCVNTCKTNPANDKKKLFHFPIVHPQSEELSKIRQARWLTVLGIDDVDEEKISSLRGQDHFISGRSADILDTQNPDWVPNLNINLAIVDGAIGFNEVDCSLYENELVNASASTTHETDVEGTAEEVQCLSEVEISETHVSVATATLSDIELQGMHQLILTLRERITALEEMLLEHTIRPDSFKNNDKKTKFFTGLTSFKTMNEVFLSLEDSLPECKNKLSKFQVFYVVLTRLRLNLSFRYLSYQFSVSEQTISKYFHEGLYVMYSKLRSLVYWPDRESIKKTMPETFRRCFGETISIIIDCFEIFLQRSTLMKAQSQTWSTYKHCNTLKYLIGITPQGLISFVSVGYGGRASDKYVTENCGFLNFIEEGDVVMTDRGLLVENALKDVGARAEIPSFYQREIAASPVRN